MALKFKWYFSQGLSQDKLEALVRNKASLETDITKNSVQL